jgi:hypothetical protein
MISAFSKLGVYLNQHAIEEKSSEADLLSLNSIHFESLEECILNEHIHNGWFTEPSIRMAFKAISDSLSNGKLDLWLEMYPDLPLSKKDRKIVGTIMAGNIPMVGFHDMLSIIASGHYFLGKLSSKDDRLMKKVVEILCDIEPRFRERIEFTDGYLKNIDAIIATGSDNSSRYFEYYFKKIPYIIRKNRNGVAILSGKESRDELILLGIDIFSYFGLGCRNVTKIYIPKNYDLKILLEALEHYCDLSQHHKYNNNLEYNRSVYLMNLLPFFDNGLVLMKEDTQFASPVGVVYYEKYSQLDNVIEDIQREEKRIQCLVTSIKDIKNSVLPGQSQSPELWNYADGVDTMKFLKELTK